MKIVYQFEVSRVTNDAKRGETTRFDQLEPQEGIEPTFALRHKTGNSGFKAGQKVRITVETVES